MRLNKALIIEKLQQTIFFINPNNESWCTYSNTRKKQILDQNNYVKLLRKTILPII